MKGSLLLLLSVFFTICISFKTADAQTTAPLGRWHKVVRLNQATEPIPVSLSNCDYRMKYSFIADGLGATYMYFLMSGHKVRADIPQTTLFFHVDADAVVDRDGGFREIFVPTSLREALETYSLDTVDILALDQRLELITDSPATREDGLTLAIPTARKRTEFFLGSSDRIGFFRDLSRFTLEERCY